MKHGKLEDSGARVVKSFQIRVATIAAALVATAVTQEFAP